MRWVRRVGAAALAVAAGVAGDAASLEAQASPHALEPEEGETFCAQLFLGLAGDVFGHEFVEFRWDPEVSDDPRALRGRDERPAAAVDRVAYWWDASPDSVGAFMTGRDDTVWRLRLGGGDGDLAGTFTGTLRQLLPVPAPHVARAHVLRLPCPRREPDRE